MTMITAKRVDDIRQIMKISRHTKWDLKEAKYARDYAPVWFVYHVFGALAGAISEKSLGMYDPSDVQMEITDDIKLALIRAGFPENRLMSESFQKRLGKKLSGLLGETAEVKTNKGADTPGTVGPHWEAQRAASGSGDWTNKSSIFADDTSVKNPYGTKKDRPS
jgi:hypothetical protein